MAALCLSNDADDLRARLGRLLVGLTYEKAPVTAADLKAVGAMMVLLKDALMPNLVQTVEGVPASSTADRSPTSPTAATR
jgi:formate--tetrahydrofolate ligase